MNQHNTAVSAKKENFNFGALIANLIRFWWVFVISAGISLLIAVLIIKLSTPVYIVNATLMVDDSERGGGSVDPSAIMGDMSNLLDYKSNVNNEIQILKTAQLAEKVVQNLDLNIRYFNKEGFREVEIYDSPFLLEVVQYDDSVFKTTIEVLLDKTGLNLKYKHNQTNETLTHFALFDKPLKIQGVGTMIFRKGFINNNKPGRYKILIVPVQHAVSAFKKELTVGVSNKLVSTIDLSYKSSIPKKGEDILATLIDEYKKEHVKEKNMVADSTIAFIENRLMLVSRELEDIETNIQIFKQTNSLADLSGQSKLLLNSSGEYNKELSELKTQIAIIESLETYLKESENKKVVPNSIISQDAGFNKLVENYNNLLQERGRKSLTWTEYNPYIKNVDDRLLEMRKAMLSSLENIKSTQKIKLEQLLGNIKGLGKEIKEVPHQERTYLSLYRQQNLKQELYLFLLKKREETALSKTANISNSKIIDYPKSEINPSSPNKMFILAAGLILGLFFPLAGLFFYDLFNNTVQNKSDLGILQEIPLAGRIGIGSPDLEYLKNNSGSAVSEHFKSLRANVLHYLQKEKGNVVMLTSNARKEGKTFLSYNLALSLAMAGKKTVLIDFDLRTFAISEKLRKNHHEGLAELMNGKINETQTAVINSDQHQNLFFLPAGKNASGNSELFTAEKINRLFTDLKEEYDFIIVDSPAIGNVSDGQLLLRFCDLVLFAVRNNVTKINDLESIKEFQSSGKVRKMCLVLNADSNLPGKIY